jgi:hypothetical protein
MDIQEKFKIQILVEGNKTRASIWFLGFLLAPNHWIRALCLLLAIGKSLVAIDWARFLEKDYFEQD